jgi:hypothetical protein
MVNWWAEQWSFGSGASRVSCGISHSDEGYVVDVCRGGSCVESFVYPSRAEAVQAAEGLKRHFRPVARATRRNRG